MCTFLCILLGKIYLQAQCICLIKSIVLLHRRCTSWNKLATILQYIRFGFQGIGCVIVHNWFILVLSFINFQHFPPSARFFPPCSFINFQKIFHPARLFHPCSIIPYCLLLPSCAAWLFLFYKKKYLHPVFLAFVHSFWLTLDCTYIHTRFSKNLPCSIINFQKISTLLVYSISARLLIFRKISTLLVYSILLDY